MVRLENQMGMFDPLRRVVTHDEVFVDRYDALLRTALHVTEGDRHAAEDLVQDAYIRFTLVQPPLDEVERLDAYFYVMLRNMHTSRVRRRRRTSEVSLSILDFDSLDIGLRAVDAAKRLEVRQTLYAACEYGCLRRHSSKAGSLFLLRFFHGYLPSEIARIAGLSTATIDDQLYRARREVDLFVRHPGQLAFVGAADAARPARSAPAIEEGDDSEALLAPRLRATIFRERHATCWSKQALRGFYHRDPIVPLTREELAGLVCCPVCLDEVNAILNMPRLASRWPTDTLGPGGPGTRAGAGGGGSAKVLASARRRKSAVFEHRPQELRVLVNGFEIGSHTLGAPHSELLLTANVDEPIALVEVFSEQELCLLFLDAAPPPDGAVRQWRSVELSEGRRAELEVSFAGPWPTIRATYVDPRCVATTEAAVPTIAPIPTIAPTVVRTDGWWTRVFGFRPAPALILWGALAVWLLFWTPGSEVSAAERIANTIKWLVAELIGSSSSHGASLPSSSSAPLASAPAAHDETAVSTPMRPSSIAAPKSTPLTAARRTALELRAIRQLQDVEAYLGQEISFGPATSSRVEIRATVDGESRKRALTKALAGLAGTQPVHAEIADLQAVTGRLRPQLDQRDRLDEESAPPPQAGAFVRDQFPMFEPLRRYFHRLQADADDAEVDAQVRRFAMRLLDHSRRASQHAWALKHLADRFSPTAINAASAETQDLWTMVLRQHAQAYQQEIASIRRALEPILDTPATVAEPALASVPPLTPAPDVDTTDAWSRVTHLLEIQKSQDDAIRASFAIRGDSRGENLVDTPAFWHRLDESDRLSVAIRRE